MFCAPTSPVYAGTGVAFAAPPGETTPNATPADVPMQQEPEASRPSNTRPEPEPAQAKDGQEPQSESKPKPEIDSAKPDVDQALAAAHAKTVDILARADPTLVPALLRLAQSLVDAAEPAEAVPVYQRSIKLLGEQGGVFDPRLIEVWTGLGKAWQTLGKPKQALDAFKRAQHITHRSYGVMNLRQIPLIASMIESQKALGEVKKTSNLQRLAIKLYQHNAGENSPQALAAMRKLARWITRQGDYRQARIIYRRVLKIQEQASPKDTPAMVPTLRGLAENDLQSGRPYQARAQRTFQRIVAIMDSAPETNPVGRILAHLDLGDAYTLGRHLDEAAEQYRTAWTLSRDESSGRYDWDAYFAKPYLIETGPTPLVGSLIMEFRAKKEWYYEFTCRVTRSGRPKDIHPKQTNLIGNSRTAAAKLFRSTHFRPRIVNGETADTVAVKVRKTYVIVRPENASYTDYPARF